MGIEQKMASGLVGGPTKPVAVGGTAAMAALAIGKIMQSTKKGRARNASKAILCRGIADSYPGDHPERPFHLSQARKYAYRSEKPGRATVPFVGRGAAGQEVLDRISRKKTTKGSTTGDKIDIINSQVRAYHDYADSIPSKSGIVNALRKGHARSNVGSLWRSRDKIKERENEENIKKAGIEYMDSMMYKLAKSGRGYSAPYERGAHGRVVGGEYMRNMGIPEQIAGLGTNIVGTMLARGALRAAGLGILPSSIIGLTAGTAAGGLVQDSMVNRKMRRGQADPSKPTSYDKLDTKQKVLSTLGGTGAGVGSTIPVAALANRMGVTAPAFVPQAMSYATRIAMIDRAIEKKKKQHKQKQDTNTKTAALTPMRAALIGGAGAGALTTISQLGKTYSGEKGQKRINPVRIARNTLVGAALGAGASHGMKNLEATTKSIEGITEKARKNRAFGLFNRG